MPAMTIMFSDKGVYKGHKGIPQQVPFELMSEGMAQRNHGQTLHRLNERGGMSAE